MGGGGDDGRVTLFVAVFAVRRLFSITRIFASAMAHGGKTQSNQIRTDLYMLRVSDRATSLDL